MFEATVNAHGNLEDLGPHAGRDGTSVELKLRLQIVLAIKPFARRIETFLVNRREWQYRGKIERGRLRLLWPRHARKQNSRSKSATGRLHGTPAGFRKRARRPLDATRGSRRLLRG